MTFRGRGRALTESFLVNGYKKYFPPKNPGPKKKIAFG